MYDLPVLAAIAVYEEAIKYDFCSSSLLQLVAEKKLDEPRTVNIIEAVPNMALLGKEFKKDAKRVSRSFWSWALIAAVYLFFQIQIALAQLSEDELVSLESKIASEG